MAIQCQYDLEAHLVHIITFLLHLRKLVTIISFAFLTSHAGETEKWRDEHCCNKERDIENDVIR